VSWPPTAITVVMAQPSGQDRAVLDEPLASGPSPTAPRLIWSPGTCSRPATAPTSASGRRVNLIYLTDMRFPGNPTRFYRTRDPLRAPRGPGVGTASARGAPAEARPPCGDEEARHRGDQRL